jgi:drug/metabolite transporter (DMT)-like permease
VLGSLSILGACFFWALDALIRYPLVNKGINPGLIVFYEHAILCFLFLPYFFSHFPSLKKLKMSEAFSFLIIGAGGSAVATMAFTASFKILNPSLVILLQKFQPVVAILLAHWILKEKLPKPFLLWAGVCLCGALLIATPDLRQVIRLIQERPQQILSDKAFEGYFLVLSPFWDGEQVRFLDENWH